MEDKIFNIKNADALDFNIKERKDPQCKHRKILVDQDVRMLECEGCGAFVDPYDWVLDVAWGDVKWKRQTEHLKEEYKQWFEKLERVKREVSRAKSALKKLEPNNPEVHNYL